MKLEPPFDGAVPVAFAEGATDQPGERFTAKVYFSDRDTPEHAIGLAIQEVEALGYAVDSSGISWEEPI